MDLHWTDVDEIAYRLLDNHPDVDPFSIRFTDLHAWVVAIPGFSDDPARSNEKVLESIQMAWHEEWEEAREG